MTAIQVENKVLWPQVWGLAAVQGAIALTWVIYNLYLAQLLQEFGFPAALATTLLVLENILAMVMEPLMGSFSDQAQHRLGTRFPFIALGVILSSLFFLGIPVVLFGVEPSQALRWLLPVVLVAWAMAMTVFRSPALSLLGRYALRTQMPLAASILTLVGGVAGAMAPLAGDFILSLGPLFAFFIGSITLLVAAGALRATGLNQHVAPVVDEVEEVSPEPAASSPQNSASESAMLRLPAGVSVQRLALIFGSGVGVALGFRFMMQTFPALVAERVPNGSVSLVVGSIFVALALTAIPAGAVATKLGMRRSIILGLSLMAVGCVVMLAIANIGLAFGVAIALGAAFSLVSNATIPFALSMVPPQKAGLGTGIYFSGGAAASSLFGFIVGKGIEVSLTVGAVAGAIAFLLAATCVAVSKAR